MKQLRILVLTPLALVFLNLSKPDVRSDLKPTADSLAPVARFGFGRPATVQQLTTWDTDVRPDGTGLPEGTGTVATGKMIYAAKCAVCHGATGVEGPQGALVSPPGDSRVKTIGNYWPYATTVFDYIRRAMPFNAPGSLTNDEVYALTAYLLTANKVMDEKTVLTAQTLSKIVMPVQKQFVPDDRRGGTEVK